MSRFVMPLVLGVVTGVIGQIVFGLSPIQSVILASVVMHLGYTFFYLETLWRRPRMRRYRKIVKEVIAAEFSNRRPQSEKPLPVMTMRPDVAAAQLRIEWELRTSEPCIVRSKVRFIQRPTEEDVQAAVEDEAVIVVRVPIPQRWRETLPMREVHRRNIVRCNAILEEIGLVDGHPRVLLLSDTCTSAAQFREKTFERFGA